jgi:hypothetical protein
MKNGRISRMARFFKGGEILMEVLPKIIGESVLQEIRRKDQRGGEISEGMMKAGLNEGGVLEDATRSETPRAKSGTIGSDLFGGEREKVFVQRPVWTKRRDTIKRRIITTVTLKHTRGKRILGMRIGNRKEGVEEKSGPLASETHDAKRTQPGTSLGLKPIVELDHVRGNVEVAHQLDL